MRWPTHPHHAYPTHNRTIQRSHTTRTTTYAHVAPGLFATFSSSIKSVSLLTFTFVADGLAIDSLQQVSPDLFIRSSPAADGSSCRFFAVHPSRQFRVLRTLW
mmetsp:Transcript_31037/g.67079  ORF Transcript_31037/g.67079 Transcript_31037/m.67079 type:complete len:103 (-) Transcript_31037:167-475(-)